MEGKTGAQGERAPGWTVTSYPKLHGELGVAWLLDHDTVQAQVHRRSLGHWPGLWAPAHSRLRPWLPAPAPWLPGAPWSEPMRTLSLVAGHEMYQFRKC